MDEQKLQPTNVKLITRSTSKKSVGHRQIVNFLENLSKDKDGAPVKWTFTKSGIHKAKGVRKKIALRVAKKIEKIPTTKKVLSKSETTTLSTKDSEGTKDSKKGKFKSNIMSDNTQKKSVGSDSPVVSIQRLNSDSQSDSSVISKPPDVVKKRKAGRSKTKKCVEADQTEVETVNEIKENSSKSVETNENVVVKRGPGRPRKKGPWTTLQQKMYNNVLKKAVNSGKKAHSNNEDNYDSSSSSTVSNVVSNLDSQRKKVHKSYHRQGIKLGPRKMLRSQDNLITRQKRGGASLSGPGKRKRTLSGEFELLEEPVRKKRQRKDEKMQDVDDDTFKNDSQNSESYSDLKEPENSVTIEAKALTNAENNLIRKRKYNSGDSNNIGGISSFDNNSIDEIVPIKSQNEGTVKIKRELSSVANSISTNSQSMKSKHGSSLSEYKDSDSSKTVSDKIHDLIYIDTSFGSNKDDSPISSVNPVRKRGRPKVINKTPKKEATKTDSVTQLYEKPPIPLSPEIIVKRSLKIVGPGGLKFTKANKEKNITLPDINMKTQRSDKQEMPQEDKSSVIGTERRNDKENDSENAPKSSLNIGNKQNIDIARKNEIEIPQDTVKCSTLKMETEVLSNSECDEKQQDKYLGSSVGTRIHENVLQNPEIEFKQVHSAAVSKDMVIDNGDTKKLSPKTEHSVKNSSENFEVVDHRYFVDIITEQDNKVCDYYLPLENKETNCNSVLGVTRQTKTEAMQETLGLQENKSTSLSCTISENEGATSKSDMLKNIGKTDIINANVLNSVSDTAEEKSMQLEQSTNFRKISEEQQFINQVKISEEKIENKEFTEKSNDSVNNMEVDTNCNSAGDANTAGTLENTLKLTNKDNDIRTGLSESRPENWVSLNTITEVEQSTKQNTEENNQVCNQSKIVDAELEDNNDVSKVVFDAVSSVQDSEKISFNALTEKSVDKISSEQENEFSDSVHTSFQAKFGSGKQMQGECNDVINNDSTESLFDNNDKDDSALGLPLQSSDSIFKEDEQRDHIAIKTPTQTDDLGQSNFSSVSLMSKDSEIQESCLSKDNVAYNNEEKVSNSKKTSTKRVFQLRQKASRSPLEIIAMRQSQEERQYILEQTRKAIRREEKQRKMRSKFQNMFAEKTIEQDKESTRSGYSCFDVEKICKPCSVVLIDFVKYLKDTQNSNDGESGLTDDDTEAIDTEEEDNGISVSHNVTMEKEMEHSVFYENNIASVDNTDSKISETLTDEYPEQVPPRKPTLKIDGRKKRKPSARKQIRNFSSSSKLMAEIMPSNEEENQSPTTVPPLRLKITGQDVITRNTVPPLKLKLNQKTVTKGKVGRPAKGAAVIRRRKARKGMSPVKPFNPVKEIEKVMDNPDAPANRQPVIDKPGFEGSFVKFINDKDIPSNTNSVSKAKDMGDDNSTINSDVKTIEDLGKTVLQSNVVDKEKEMAHLMTPLKHQEQVETFESEFICKTCDFVTSNRNIMESHIYVHLKNVPFKCVYCQRTFRSRGVAFIHMRSVHPDQEARMETAEDIDEREYYREIRKSIPVEQHTIVQTNTGIASLQQSPDSLIISVVLPRNVTESTARYCCSYCNFAASSQQDILDHINSNHRHDIQYTCSLCDKAVFGYKEGIAQHFAEVHPNKPVLYKSMPDFYDRKGANEKLNTGGSQDKGNIFERMSDLFSSNAQNQTTSESAPEHHVEKRNSLPEKTSAEADSTTADSDEIVSNQSNIAEKEQDSNEKDISVNSTNLHTTEIETYEEKKTDSIISDDSGEKEVDGIEELAKIYGESFTQLDDGKAPDSNEKSSIEELTQQPASIQNSSIQSTVISSEVTDANAASSVENSAVENDMGLKIVDVVSLRDSGAFTGATWGQDIMQTNTQKSNVPEQVVQKETVIKSSDKTSLSVPLNIPKPKEMGSLVQSPLVSNVPKTSERMGTTYKCERCCVHAPLLSIMVEHLRSSHRDINRLFLCPFCRQYEGSTEPDIHRHIKQFHNNPNQKSPPVALSSAAKKHLRTIQVPVGDTVKVTDGKPVIDKDIYKCLKCLKHMPSLDYIYDHLEKEHNEVFVYVCPDCKKFRAKEEEVVYNHIKTDHNKSTDNIILSLAIEENLFTRVQSLMKDKPGHSKPSAVNKTISGNNSVQPSESNQQTVIKQTAPMNVTHPNVHQSDVIVVGESKKLADNMLVRQQPQQRLPMPMQSHNMQPGISPSSSQSFHSGIAHQGFVNRQPPPAHALQNPIPLNQIQSKSALRKSRPVQIRQHVPEITQNLMAVPNRTVNMDNFNMQRFPQQALNQTQSQSQQNFMSQAGPPPLIRGPPPLLRFDPISNSTSTMMTTSTVLSSEQQQQRNDNVSQGSSVRNVSFSMTDRLQRLHSNKPGGVGPVQSPEPGTSPSGRPLLKVPSVTPVLGSSRTFASQNNSNSNFAQNRSLQNDRNSSGGASTPLDLSKGYGPVKMNSSPVTERQTGDDDVEEISPDAFQIFNLRPSAPTPPNRLATPTNVPPQFAFQRIGQQQMRPISGMQQQLQANMPQRLPNQVMQNRPQRPPSFIQRGLIRQPNRGPTSNINNMTNVPVYQSSPQAVQRQITTPSNVAPQNMANMADQVFKCPYCPNVVPLGMADVAPHIEKFHPGHSIMFMKRDS